MEIIRNEETGTLRIAGTLDISAADALRDALAGALQPRCRLVLDLAGVDKCDTAGVQVLCSASKYAERLQAILSVENISEGVRDTCAVLGLSLDALATGWPTAAPEPFDEKAKD